MSLWIAGIIFYGLMCGIFGAFLWRVSNLRKREEE